jgi:hypothetical protein
MIIKYDGYEILVENIVENGPSNYPFRDYLPDFDIVEVMKNGCEVDDSDALFEIMRDKHIIAELVLKEIKLDKEYGDL